MHKNLSVALWFFLIFNLIGAQDIQKKWFLNSNQNNYISFQESEYESVLVQDSIVRKGDFIVQSNFLFLYENQSVTPTSKFLIQTLSDSTLVLKSTNHLMTFSSEKEESKAVVSTIISSQGYSFGSISRGILGMFFLICLAFLLSKNRKAIDWKKVAIGLSIQLLIALAVLKAPFIQSIFEFIGNIFINILDFTKAGSKFLFDGLVADMNKFGYIFAFQVLPTIIFFSALTSLLFYLGIIQWVVKILAKFLSKFLGISGMESLSVAGNIFLGQTEAPLLIKAYLDKMNRSEMLLVMIGGMATVAGAVLAAYIGFLGGGNRAVELIFAKHLLTASVMAAPGAIVISKILYPQTEKVNTDVTVSQEKIGSNVLEAIANGTTEGLRLAVNVGAMLLVFVAVIAMLNGILGAFGSFSGIAYFGWSFTSINEVITNNTAYNSLSLEFILGTIFAPLMWIIGVAKEDMTMMGQLLGIKLAASEFIGYIQLAELKNPANLLHFKYEKSIIMATYMLCGFANFASIGIQIGGIGSLAPSQRKTLSEFGIKALIGGSIASLLSATIAGMIIG